EYALQTVAAVHTVSGTLLRNRFHANRARWAWDGVYPRFLAWLWTLRRRSFTIASGMRAAISRTATRSPAPRYSHLSTRRCESARNHTVSSTGCTRPATASKRAA